MHNICFQFLQGITLIPRETEVKTVLMQHLWVGRGGGGTRCIRVKAKVANEKKKLDNKSATPPHKKFVPQAEVKLMRSRG